MSWPVIGVRGQPAGVSSTIEVPGITLKVVSLGHRDVYWLTYIASTFLKISWIRFLFICMLWMAISILKETPLSSNKLFDHFDYDEVISG